MLLTFMKYPISKWVITTASHLIFGFEKLKMIAFSWHFLYNMHIWIVTNAHMEVEVLNAKEIIYTGECHKVQALQMHAFT